MIRRDLLRQYCEELEQDSDASRIIAEPARHALDHIGPLSLCHLDRQGRESEAELRLDHSRP